MKKYGIEKLTVDEIDNLIRSRFPLAHDYEDDARDIWPARYNALLEIFAGSLERTAVEEVLSEKI